MKDTPSATTPSFSTWGQETLADFARDAFTQMLQDRGVIEQLRLDLKDAMKELRKYQDDWR